MSQIPETPAAFAKGARVTAVVGPTKVTRTGTVTGTDGQFVVFDAKVGEKTKSLKARPRSFTAYAA